MALVLVPVMLVVLVLCLNRTALGVAVRASADRTARALTLGVPVKRLHSLIWTIVTVGAFAALFFTAGTGGLGVGYGTSLGLLLRAIAALTHGPPNGQPVPVAMSTPKPSRLASRTVWASWSIHAGDR